MNASFEDIAILDDMIEQYHGDWHQILPAFQHKRKIDADAIADLAVENEVEMRDATADPVFFLKRQIELRLEQQYPDYYSKYSMVTFREDIPYNVAKEKGRAQDKILMAYAAEIKSMEALDENVIMSRLKAVNN
jgi:kynurenine 3-monooxygenase